MYFDIARAKIEIRAGACLLITCDLEFVKKTWINSSDCSCFNFPVNGSKLVLPHFETLDSSVVKKTVRKIKKISGVKLRTTNDATGRLLVDVLSELETYDTVVAGLAGLAYNSIDFCIDIAKRFLATEQNKRIIFVSVSEDTAELTLTLL
ncbi:MAG: hypothetical protein ABW007_06980 [Chitinophagaceae bacterium]